MFRNRNTLKQAITLEHSCVYVHVSAGHIIIKQVDDGKADIIVMPTECKQLLFDALNLATTYGERK